MTESSLDLDRTRRGSRLTDAIAPPDGAASYDGVPRGERAPPPDRNDEPDGLGRRFMRPQTLISFGLAIFIVLFFFRQLDVDLDSVWRNIRRTNLGLYAAAFGVFYGAFVLRAIRWRMMLARVGVDEAHGYAVPGIRGLIQIFLLSWFVNCVVPAKLGDAYRGYLLKRECGAPFSTSLGTILAERVTDLVVLFTMMAGSAVLVFHGTLPGQASQTVWIGCVLLAIGAVGLAGLWFARAQIQRRVPDRWQEQFARLHFAIFACLRRPAPFVAISVGIWTCEGLRLLLVVRALGSDVSPATALFVALMGSLLTTLPITPAGLGVVEVATIKVLQLVDVETSLAGSIALLDRVVGYWSVIVVGFALYLWRVRREIRSDRA
jgi:glycosyltransferase 2 family protein